MGIFSGATDLLKQARKTVLAKSVQPVLREAGFRVTAALSTRVTLPSRRWSPDWKQNENALLSVMLLGHAGRLEEARRRFEDVTGDRAAHLKMLSHYGIVL